MATTLAEIWEELHDEVAGRIKNIVPTLRVNANWGRFDEYSGNADEAKPFEEKPGRARLFWIGDVNTDGQWGPGNTTSDEILYAPILFWYPRTKRWNVAAQDDMRKIIHDLECNQTTIASAAYVNQRIIDRTVRVQVTQDSSQPWDMYALRLKAIIRVTHS